MTLLEHENHYDFRVAWEHTDTAGYVHNSVYFRYFELGECDWFRKLGIPWNTFMDVGFPRVHVEADFLHPLFFEDACRLITRVLRVRAAKVYLAHRLWRGDECVAKGNVVFACVRSADGRATPLPTKMRDILQARVEAGR